MIVLGSHVKDNVTGFAGVAIARTEWLHGCARVIIQPTELKEGKPQETHAFDEQQVEYINEKTDQWLEPTSITTGPTPLGSKVRDTLTGLEGIAYGRTCWINHGAEVQIQPTTLNKDGGIPKAEWIAEARVALVEVQKPKVSPQSSARSGGPQSDPVRRSDR